uniref:Innexin n=1 Tax=Timema cristinae TaxID=61476 RepID=A0A7R9CI77_TIMCR|nr:unnamed protein product [Timema cristinae]
MFDLFGSVRALLKVQTICIDNNVFRLHYKATVVMLVVFSLLVTSKQYFGDPIICLISKNALRSNLIDSYCWVYSTFTVPRHLKEHLEGLSGSPGVGSYVEGEDEVIYHKYYQWVCFVLFFQAILFYVPRYLWKLWEGGRLKLIALNLDSPLVSEVWTPERRKTVLEYLDSCGHHHNLYAFRFVVCETLNFINVVGQIFFLDVFLAGEFIRYGPKVLSHIPDGHDIDPMVRVFPKLAKCTFNYFGPSGTQQVLDSLCMLPLNVVNEKVFVFLWFWLVLLSFLSFAALAYRLAVFVSPSLRSRLLLAQVRFMPRTTVGLVVHAASPADWFFLRQLGKNLNPEVFKDILEHLASRFADKGSVA